jgi:hypothetical protein
MPFTAGIYYIQYGTGWGAYAPKTYCQGNTSASDYGKCYNVVTGKAIFIQSDTTNYPQLPCELDNTCTRYTSSAGIRNFGTAFSYTNKQAIVTHVWSRAHTNTYPLEGNIQRSASTGIIIPSVSTNPDASWIFPSPNYELSSWPAYNPVTNLKIYVNPYTITSGNVVIIHWYGSFLTTSVSLLAWENGNNIWYASDFRIVWTYESSPLAIIPLDYENDYIPYQELRNVFGYAATGIDQPGWNADDIISVLRELFSDRAWAVFDDRTYTLFLYNLTPDFVPDWLIDKLSPTAMKVLTRPSDSSIANAWLDELNRRNVYNQPPPEAI